MTSLTGGLTWCWTLSCRTERRTGRRSMPNRTPFDVWLSARGGANTSPKGRTFSILPLHWMIRVVSMAICIGWRISWTAILRRESTSKRTFARFGEQGCALVDKTPVVHLESWQYWFIVSLSKTTPKIQWLSILFPPPKKNNFGVYRYTPCLAQTHLLSSLVTLVQSSASSRLRIIWHIVAADSMVSEDWGLAPVSAALGWWKSSTGYSSRLGQWPTDIHQIWSQTMSHHPSWDVDHVDWISRCRVLHSTSCRAGWCEI